MWRRIKMFNMKLIIMNAMRKLRINVLMSELLFWGVPWFSASFSALAVRASVTTLFTWGTSACVATPWSSLIQVMVAGGTLSLLLFQGVRPVTRSISPRMIQVSCALNAGSVSWFPLGLGWAGGAPPLPVPPRRGFPLLPPPHPRSGCLGNVVVCNLCPLIGTLWCTDEDFSVNQSSGVDDW